MRWFRLGRSEAEASDTRSTVRKPRSYQSRRHPEKKYELIYPVLKQHGVMSVLDVGCNAGFITRLAGKAGFFAVGFDYKVQLDDITDPLEAACLGVIRFDLDLAQKIPRFDAILLLSVYHQWIKEYGDEHARTMLRALVDKASKVLLIELSGRAKKYGFESSQHFQDHDENSVVGFWRDYLISVLPAFETTYVGKSWEKQSEPFRYLFACARVK